jgi:superfamily II DNA or RNA helicase
MPKEVQLKTGEIIKIIEKLSYWSRDIEYFKIQREDGNYFVIQEDDLNMLIKDEGSSSQLSTSQKLKLFYSYFRGRPDVYATKWQSKSGKKGFSPHGEGRWVVKDGRNRKEIDTYYPYTLETVNDHIRTEKYDFKMGAGIYPMLADDTTYLVVMDFDSEGAEEEAKAVISVCRKNDIDILIERSQSGQGIHIWLFFETAIAASTARLFAQLILRHAMAELDVINFSSFDRMIPMQDTLPSKGFGNIIALPLRADKVKENKTVFLNDELTVVDDLWVKLASISKHTYEEVQSFIESFKKSLPIQFYKQEDEKLAIELPENLNITIAGELIIDKHQISKKALVQLAHLATIHNPEFYKKQNMRTSTWDTPQFITSASEDENSFYLPRGLKPKLDKLNTDIEYNNQLIEGHPIEVSFHGELRDHQKDAANELLSNDTGIISAPTGFGKTVVAAHTIAKRKISTLIIVNSKVLADQWKERLEEFLEVQSEPFTEYTPTGRVRKKDKIGEWHSGKENLSHNIDIALFQTLANRENLAEYLENYGMVIVDEAHHAAAKTFEDVLKQVKARYLYGLTATPERKDGLTPILFMRLGEMIYKQEGEQNDGLLTPKYFYPRFTSYSDYNPELNYQTHLNNMLEMEERNRLIISDVLENVKEGRPCLVLTERVQHIEVLEKMLTDELEKNTNIFTLSSEQTKKENEASIDEMQTQKNAFVVIATSQYIGEGFDLPQLESVFFCLPFSWKGRTNQYIGRLHRNVHEKSELRVYDYIDVGVEMFARMYQKRMKEYSKLNYQIAEDDKTRANQTQLYNATTYKDSLQFDFAQTNEIIIGIVSARQIKPSKLKDLKAAGKEVVLLMKKDKFKNQPKTLKTLREIGIELRFLENNPFSFIICDKKIIWYGDLKFFMNNKKDSTTLRLLNHEIADKMLDQYLT